MGAGVCQVETAGIAGLMCIRRSAEGQPLHGTEGLTGDVEHGGHGLRGGVVERPTTPRNKAAAVLAGC